MLGPAAITSPWSLVSGPPRYGAARARLAGRASGRLSGSTWGDLVRSPDVHAATKILADTRYAHYQNGIDDWRTALRRASADAYRIPLPFLPQGPRRIVESLGRQSVAENLKRVLRGIHTGRSAEEILSALGPMPSGVAPGIRWDRMAAARSLEAAVRHLGGTPFGAVSRALESARRRGHSFPLEASLDRDRRLRLRRQVRRLRGRDRREADRFVMRPLVASTVLEAFRYRDHLGLTPEETVAYTALPGPSTRGVQAVADGADVVAALDAAHIALDLASTSVDGFAATGQRNAPHGSAALSPAVDSSTRGSGPTVPPALDSSVRRAELALARSTAREARRAWRGFSFHFGAVLGWLFLEQAESRDVISVLEGLQGGFDPHWIASRQILSPTWWPGK